MKIHADLHIHSCLSPCADMDMTPLNICAMAKLKGLDAIAVTDHNSARNLPAVQKAAQEHGLALLPGMEITTREEVHLLVYFPAVEQALAAGEFLYCRLPDIRNDPRLFGEQAVMGEGDALMGMEQRLLISATDLSIRQAVLQMGRFGGHAVPAHINRGTNGMLVNLGFLPADIDFPALEVSSRLPVPKAVLSGKILLNNSDAHRLEDIYEAIQPMEVDEATPLGLLHVLGEGRVRFL